MLTYMNHNANPKGRKTTDCTTRAVAEATGLPYEEAAGELFGEWMATGWEMTEAKTVGKVLARHGFTPMGKPFKPNGRTYKVREMDEVLPPGSTAVLQVANHLTCVKGGSYLDLWDCGSKSVYRYWLKSDKTAI